MPSRPSTAALRPDMDDQSLGNDASDDPVLRSVLSAPVRSGQPPEWEDEALHQATVGPWFSGASVSTEIAARARRGR